ncbi:G-protein alpha subunit-domain-containing protein [Hypomontagnella monticulosa]|nr:G-protein alpha subunit-domain-containing protein [Hypomontagnella monticulosa]
MDPVTIFQIVGTVVSVGDAVIKCANRLTVLKSKYNDASLLISALIGQLYTVKTAIDQLSEWKARAHHEPRYLKLTSRIGNALDGFSPLVYALQAKLDQFNDDDEELSRTRKLSFLWTERELGDYLTFLDRQVNALNLLLNVIQCEGWPQQQAMIRSEQNQDILRQAQDCSSSIIGLIDRPGDTSSIISDNASAISMSFDFDSVILGSRLYQQAARSHLRQAITANGASRVRSDTNDIISRSMQGFARSHSGAGLVSSPIGRARNGVRDHQSNVSKVISNPNEAFIGNRVDIGRGEPLDSLSHLISALRRSRHQPDRVLEILVTVEMSVQTTHRNEVFHPQPLYHHPSGWEPTRLKPIRTERGPYQTRKSVSGSKLTELLPLPMPRIVEQDEIGTPICPTVLLSGISESGKSTLLAKLRHTIQPDYFDGIRFFYSEIIWDDIMGCMNVVLEKMKEFGIPLENPENNFYVEQFMREWPDWTSSRVPEALRLIAHAIQSLWEDQGFQTAYKRRAEYHLSDNAEYYLVALQRLAEELYTPTNDDIIRCKVRTISITKHPMQILGSTYNLIDVGGTRALRAKLEKVRENVSTIIFTVDVMALDVEDNMRERMLEQLSLFGELINCRKLENTGFIIVFTKIDLLERRLTERPIEQYMNNIIDSEEGEAAVREYLDYLEEQFLAMVEERNPDEISIIHANLVDLNTSHPAEGIFDILDSHT